MDGSKYSRTLEILQVWFQTTAVKRVMSLLDFSGRVKATRLPYIAV